MITYDIPISQAWDFFQANKDRLKEEYILACEDSVTGLGIYMTMDANFLDLAVFDGEEMIEDAYVVSDKDCQRTYQELVDEHMDVSGPTVMGGEVEFRESQLMDALDDFLDMVLDDMDGFAPSAAISGRQKEAILDDICELLGLDYELPVYRPRVFLDMDGTEVFVEFPYSDACLEAGFCV